MDDKQLKASKEKLDKLNREIASLTLKERQSRGKLDNELDLKAKATSERAVLLDGLIGATAEAAAQTHKKIDALDSQIRAAERMSESFQRLLEATTGELAAVVGERDNVNQIVGQEENARAFAMWTAVMQENFVMAHQALAAAREGLARLTTTAARGGERFGGPAQSWAAAEFDKFEHLEHNPTELGGFKTALPWFRNLLIAISPMTRG